MRNSTHKAHNADTASVSIRTIASGDEEGLRGMLSRLSRKSIYLRFHMPFSRVPEWAVVAFSDADHGDGESLVAVAEGEIVAHAMYVRSVGQAEFAVVVEDEWQGRGVGKMLLSEIAARAGDRGVGALTGSVLGENRRMLGLVRSVFDEVSYAVEDGAYKIRAPLPLLASPRSEVDPDTTYPLGLSA